MPRRKQQNIPPDYYYGSMDYGMDEYEDPIDCMSPEEIRRLADYVEMIQGGRYANRQRRQVDDDDNLPVNPDTLYPEEEYSDDEEEEESEDTNINEESEDDDEEEEDGPMD